MDPDRFRRVDELLQAALAIPPNERHAFLRHACRGDHALESEVWSLLAAQEQAGEFLENRAIQVAARALARQRSTEHASDTRVGCVFSHYRIIEKLGGGGMGVVYKGEDTRLRRFVALKFLPDEFAPTREDLHRFEREARAASALNHPNICTIYDIGDDEQRPFIVMEYLDGITLRQRIVDGPLQMETLLTVAMDIAGALNAAHSAGIVHRDIKPSNIFVTRPRTGSRSYAKILDFGLVQLTGTAGGACSAPSEPLTDPGMALGTPGYMSPEQGLGRPLDSRTDLYSFGSVLQEMLGSRQAPELERIISKCMERDRERRYQHASEILTDLERLKSGAPTRAPTLRKMMACAALAILAVVVAGYLYVHRAPKLTGKDTLVLADFINTTGDPVFDGTLRQGLAVQLEQSPFLSLISDERIQQTLRLMARPTDVRLTPELAREICERTGSAAVLEGSIANLGTHYVLGLRARTCRTGDLLDEEQMEVARREDILNSLSQIGNRFRRRVGESLATIERHSTPLAEATTPSLEALKAYSAGWKVAFSVGFGDAVPLVQRAIEIDPKFAEAYAFLGRLFNDIGESRLSAEVIRKAYQLRDRASDREKFFITASYELDVTGNLEKATSICVVWAQTYPRDPVPHGLLSFAYEALDKYEASIEEARRSIALDPDFTPGYTNLSFTYAYLERLAEAEDAIKRAAARGLEIPDLLVLRYYVAFLRGDEAGMRQAVALGQGKSGAEDWISHEQALTLAYSGRLHQARAASQHAVALARQAGRLERAALWQTGAAVWESLFGNAPAAKRDALAALELSKARDVEYGAALALAWSQDSFISRTLTADLEKRFPEDTSVRFSYLPALKAIFALNRSAPSQAVENLQIAAPHELALPASALFAFFGSLYPAYIRGNAHLAMHQGAKAASEFQKILDHRGIIFCDPVGAVTRLQLARAFSSAGDEAGAKAAYENFLKLWKEADADVPILQQAKLEYARLP